MTEHDKAPDTERVNAPLDEALDRLVELVDRIPADALAASLVTMLSQSLDEEGDLTAIVRTKPDGKRALDLYAVQGIVDSLQEVLTRAVAVSEHLASAAGRARPSRLPTQAEVLAALRGPADGT